MINYDRDFLKELDKARIKTHYAKIVLLSFDEKPIKEIQGTITSGNINVNGSSAIRRTVSLSMAIDDSIAKITEVDNQISINKKIKIEIGLKIPFKKWIKIYGDTVWFPQGIFILSSVSMSHNTNSWSLSITAKDKMCLLDGTAGGTLPAAFAAHVKNIEETDGSITHEYPLIREIIYEAVNHYGCEDSDKIIISDLEDQAKMLMKYDGTKPIYLIKDSKDNRYIGLSYDKKNEEDIKIISGQDAGYEMTDFTYPGELVLNAGDTVVTLLDKITKILGNFQFYYDIEGNFIFEEIKNYVNNQSPLNQLEDAEATLPGLPASDYFRIYNNKRPVYSLTDLNAVAAITHNPKYDNIKNDFYVWGKRQGTDRAIRYHLSIDAKPDLDLAKKYMWEVDDEEGNIDRYVYSDTGYPEDLDDSLKIGGPCNEWREELYRQALDALTQSGLGSYNNYYYEELLTEWRKLYDPTNTDWEATGWWNPDVFNNPENLDFWLDFIDSGSEMGRYSVSQIGRRTKIVNNDKIKTIYNKEVPDIVFIPSDLPREEKAELINHYNQIGQPYFQLQPQYQNLFSISTTSGSCYDEIRELMYQHLNYNATINITCLPIYYLEANDVIYVEDTKSGIIGNYQITQFTLPLTYNGTMSITATEVFTRI